MGYVAKLTKAGKTLDLSSGRYSLGNDFIPPRTDIVPITASGTSANRYRGASKVGEVAVNGSLIFSVRIMGNSSSEVDRGVRDIAYFLRQAGDEYDPLFFEWRSNNDVGFEPIWGQYGANMRVEVLGGTLDRWPLYGQGSLKDRAVMVTIALTLKPFALGKRQRVASATGFVFEDTVGEVDGRSRGIKLPSARTNLFNNPIFGHPTYNNDWTAGANIVETKNTDPNFVLFGQASVKLQALESTANNYTESVPTTTTDTWCVSCYVKLPDGSAPSSSVCEIYGNGAAQTTTFVSKGNGWYRAFAIWTSTANPSACGIEVYSGYTVYVDGMQCENSGYASPLVCGDFLGCSWAGTAHDSDSTSVASFVRIPAADCLNIGQGTIRVVWSPDVTNGHGTDLVLFDHSSAGELVGYFDVSENKFVINVNGTALASSTQTFSYTTKMVLHFVYSPSTLQIYRDGTQILSGAWGGPPTVSSGYLYIGKRSDLSEPGWGTYMGFATFDRAMSSTEVAADYANIYQLVADNQRVDSIPYLWAQSGSADTAANCNDSTYDNWVAIGGIAGDSNAETEYRIAMSNIAARQAIIGIMTHDYGRFVNPADYLYGEQSGTADGGSSGGEYYTKSSVGTSATLIGPSTSSMSQAGLEELLGRDVYMVARLYDASASTLRLAIYYPIPQGSIGDYRNVTMPATTWGLHYTAPISLPAKKELLQSLEYNNRSFATKSFGLYGRHVSGTSDVSIDFFTLIPRPMAILGDGAAITGPGFILNGTSIAEVSSDFTSVYEKSYITGDSLDLFPDKLNVLISHLGYASDAVINRSLTYTIYITPRWSIA